MRKFALVDTLPARDVLTYTLESHPEFPDRTVMLVADPRLNERNPKAGRSTLQL